MLEQARNSRQVRGVPAPLLLASTANANSHPQLANGHGGHWAPINGSTGVNHHHQWSCRPPRKTPPLATRELRWKTKKRRWRKF